MRRPRVSWSRSWALPMWWSRWWSSSCMRAEFRRSLVVSSPMRLTSAQSSAALRVPAWSTVSREVSTRTKPVSVRHRTRLRRRWFLTRQSRVWCRCSRFTSTRLSSATRRRSCAWSPVSSRPRNSRVRSGCRLRSTRYLAPSARFSSRSQCCSSPSRP